jgi:hypothetical protein
MYMNLGGEVLLLLVLVVEMVLLLVLLGHATGHGVGFSPKILMFNP